jgi:ribosomal-protein-serine acetyltransferase
VVQGWPDGGGLDRRAEVRVRGEEVGIDPRRLEVPEHFATERLDLRAPDERHAAELHAAVMESHESIRRWMPWAAEVQTVEQFAENSREALQQYRARLDFRLHLFLKGTGTFVGGSGLHRPDWTVPSFEIGYWVRDRFQGQGYVTEAVTAIADIAFDVLGARRVDIRMSTRNERSRRVAERAGFELEGTLRNDGRHLDGSLRDTLVFARVR